MSQQETPARYDVRNAIMVAIREGGATEERMAELLAEHAPEIPEASRPLAVKELTSGLAASGYALIGVIYAALKDAGEEAKAEEMIAQTVGAATWIDDTKGEGTIKLWKEKAGEGKPLATITAKI